MKLFVLGATGRTGGEFLRYALAEGHTVTALVRKAGALAMMHPRLTVVEGDATDGEAMTKASREHDAIVSALGDPNPLDPDEPIPRVADNLVAAAKANDIRRVIAMAGAGVLQATDELLRREMPGFPEHLQPITTRHIETWRALRESDLDWTLVCCPNLPNADLTREFRVEVDYLPSGGGSISTQDAAYFMLKALKATHTFGKRVGLAY